MIRTWVMSDEDKIISCLAASCDRFVRSDHLKSWPSEDQVALLANCWPQHLLRAVSEAQRNVDFPWYCFGYYFTAWFPTHNSHIDNALQTLTELVLEELNTKLNDNSNDSLSVSFTKPMLRYAAMKLQLGLVLSLLER